MKRATDEILKRISDVDFIIEVLDARGINLTSNDELKRKIKTKPIIQIALKNDLSDLKHNDEEIVFCNIKNKETRDIIIHKLNSVFSNKINSLKNKGLTNPEFIGMVVGIPNVGKSSLINLLSKKISLKVENRSGVTKKQEIRRINKNFYLIDTPGIFFKNINNFEDGCKLVILNTIRKDVVPITEVLLVTYNYFLKNYNKQLKKFYDFNNNLSFCEFVDFIAKKYKFFSMNNEIDLNRTYQFIFDNFSNSKICTFHFE